MQEKICRKCNKLKSGREFHRVISEYCKACKNKAMNYKKRGKNISPTLKKYIIERDHWTCQTCDIKVHDGGYDSLDKAQIDHVMPVSLGGKTEPKNLRLLCKRCNLIKSAKIDTQLELF